MIARWLFAGTGMFIAGLALVVMAIIFGIILYLLFGAAFSVWSSPV